MIQQSPDIQCRHATLALGGGGARGLAHLGVIEVLQQTPITIERIVGVSIGSLAGALCALDQNTGRVQQQVIDYLTSDGFRTRQAALFAAAPAADDPSTSGLFAWYRRFRNYLGTRRQMIRMLRRPALLPAKVLQSGVDALIPDIDIADLPLPLSVVAMDLYSGQPVVLETGSLRKAVMASAAIPGVFPPVQLDGMLLCDIGLIDALPTRIAAQRSSDLTVAVDIGSRLESVQSCRTAADIFLRLSNLGEHLVRDYSSALADALIVPDVACHPWFDFRDPAALIHAGRTAATMTVAATSFLSPVRSEARLRSGGISIVRNSEPVL